MKENTDAFDMLLLGTLDPNELYVLCCNTGPNKIAEKYIAKKAYCSCYYARDVLKGRFKLGEKVIAKFANTAYWYAIHILKGRFKLGEPVIKNSGFRKEYESIFNVKL